MSIVVLSGADVMPTVSLSGMLPELERRLSEHDGVTVVRPPGLRGGSRSATVPPWLAAAHAIRRADTVFWVQMSKRPPAPVWALAYVKPTARRSAWVVDPWRQHLPQIAKLAALQRLAPLFVPFRQAAQELQSLRGDFVWCPYAADTTAFNTPASSERSTFAYLMGRGHEPIHDALTAYAEERGLVYTRTRGGEVGTLDDVARRVGDAEYFVTTPPDLDDPARTGGLSPLVMRYFEGLAGGARLLGTVPDDTEFDALLPRNGIVAVQADGSDLATKLDADRADTGRTAAAEAAQALVQQRHGWKERAAFIVETLRRERGATAWDAAVR